jgi:heme-degrading monooxygenase HmoA
VQLLPVVGRVASFHLSRWPGAASALSRLALDRRALGRVPGLEFWRLLGTGRGSATAPGADLRRTALFAVWSDESACRDFCASHPLALEWQAADEHWRTMLRSRGGHGTWRGLAVPDVLERGADDGPLAVITRAHVRTAAWRRFGRAGRPVDGSLGTAEGLLAVVGIGEAPRGRLGTFSLWRSLDDAVAWASGSAPHREVVRRTRAERWYGEEMFARFEPYASTGSWDGRDPLR